MSETHITKLDGEPASLRRVPRVRVAMIVMDYFAYGWSAEEMCRQHPYLTPAEAHAALAYYYDHQEEIEAEIAHEDKEVKRDRATKPRSPFFMRIHADGLR